jgi:signal transduction histidine kinase
LQAHNVVQQHLTYSQPLDNIAVFELQEADIQTNRPTVLLVEDNLNLLYYMHANLRDTYNVFWATNGQEALEKLQNIPRPDIIVADIMMDVMDGYQFYEELSRREQYRDIPFIFLTARTSLDEKLKGLSSGAIDYIYKPFVMSELTAKIASIIRNQEVKKVLYEREKYTTLGMLFGEISHELLNPLEGIYAPLENLEKQCKKILSEHPNELTGYFDRIYKNLQRMQDLLTSLKILRYRKEIKRTPVQIEELLSSVIELFQETIRHRITINYHIDKEVEIQGNREALMHILINLLSNAIDAIEREGEISIAVENKGNKPVISIKDTGCGIAPQDLERIFDAFYTSKEIGQGTGLGLYIVKDLVLKLGWQIAVQSTVGKGTEILITT